MTSSRSGLENPADIPAGGTGDMRYEFTVTSNQELADKCAKQQDELANTAGAIQGFFINDFLVS